MSGIMLQRERTVGDISIVMVDKPIVVGIRRGVSALMLKEFQGKSESPVDSK
jgi:hypothetical protein